MLGLVGVVGRIDARDFFWPEDRRSVQHHNAITGFLIAKRFHSDDSPLHQTGCRMVRSKPQRALLSAVDVSRIHVRKKLLKLEDESARPDNSNGNHRREGIQLYFDDGKKPRLT